MRKIALLATLLLFGWGLNLQAQKKELSLNDAVLKGFSTLGPERMSNLQWVKNANSLSCTSADGDEIIEFAAGGNTTPMVLLSQVNTALDLSLARMPFIRWINNQEFYFSSKGKYYQYNYQTKTGSMIMAIPAGAANLDFDVARKRLAYTVDNNLYLATPSEAAIKVTDIADANVVSGQAIARYEFGIGKGTFWSPKGSHLAFYQKDETAVADYPLLDISTTPGTLRKIKYPMAGQKSETAKVGIYNTKTNKTIYLKVTGDPEQYLTNLAWGPEEKFVYIAVVNRDQNQMWLNKYDVATGNLVKTLFEEKHERYVEPEHPVWFLPNNNSEFLWMSERDGFQHVYRYNTDGKLLNQITKGKWVVQNILGLDDTGKRVVVEATDDTGLNIYAYVSDLQSEQSERINVEAGVHRFALSDNGAYLLDRYSNLQKSSVINLINLKGNRLKNLLTSENPLEEYRVGTTEIFDLQGADGTTLHARMIKPSDFGPQKKYPVLVYVYGGPHAQMVTNRWLGGAPLWMHYMAEKGYIIFTVDNRGSKNRGFEFESVIHRKLGDAEIADQIAAVNYLKSLPYIDGDRMAVHGWSYGGFMTTSLMLREPGTFKVGVAGGPVTDWKYYEIMYGERYMDRPEENPAGYKKARLMEYTQNLEGDLLLIHGTVDDVVVMQHNLSLVQKFVQDGILIDFMPYPMHPHNVRGKDRVHLMNKVLSYIEDKLKP